MAPIKCIDKKHQMLISSYVKKTKNSSGAIWKKTKTKPKIDMARFEIDYLRCVNMGTVEFQGHLDYVNKNLKFVIYETLAMESLFHAIHAALPFQEATAIKAQETADLEIHENAKLEAARMKLAMEVVLGPEDEDPDAALR